MNRLIGELSINDIRGLIEEVSFIYVYIPVFADYGLMSLSEVKRLLEPFSATTILNGILLNPENLYIG